MVKKTQITYLLKTIKKNGVSFIAVALIAATSIAIYLGIQSGAVAILKHAGQNFAQNRLATSEITCANGITHEDIDALAEQPEVDTVEGGYRTMALIDSSTEKITVQIRSLLKELNRPTVMEGELPAAADEVAIEKKFASQQDAKVGDIIKIEHDGELLNDTFVITAIINEPSFSSGILNDSRGKSEAGFGSAAYYMEVAPEAFDASYYDDCYTTAYVENKGLNDIYFYSEEYDAKEEGVLDNLEKFGEERAEIRYESLSQDVGDKISDARQELEDAREEYRSGETELENARKDLNNNKKELDKSLTAIKSALRGLGFSENLNEAKTQLEAIGPAGAELRASITEYENGLAKVAKAEADFADSEKELADAKNEIDSAQTQLEDAQKDAAEIEYKDWVVSGRNDMGDVRAVKIIVDGLFTLSYSFALIFLLVAVIVCYAAVVKMIDDNRSLIGAQKALGFQTKEIFAHFMSYNVLCAVLGIIIGCVCSVLIVENLVLIVFAREFVFEKIALSFVGGNAVLVCLLCLVIFVLATIAGCTKVLRQSAISLLRGEMPTQQKAYFFESWKGYKALSLYGRTMIKNVLSDKGRILTTIMGVVGCISLLIITFTLKFAVTNAPAMQFEKYFFFENRLAVNSEICEVEDYEEILNQEGISYSRIQDKLENFRTKDGKRDNIHVVAVDSDEQIEGFIYPEDVETRKAVNIPDDGVLISKKCADNFELEKGSVIEIMDADGNPREFKVSGVIDHYLPYHQMITSVDYYEEVMGEKADKCIFLLKGNIDGLYEKVKTRDGFLSLKDNSEYLIPFESINLVIIICFVFSAILAVLVLLNQMNMYINRKSRELAVMRINGYTLKETKNFVSRDNIVLVILGLIVGCGIGIPLAQFEVMIMETGTRRYITSPDMLACFLSVLICIVFALIINKIALRKINNLNLTNVSGN